MMLHRETLSWQGAFDSEHLVRFFAARQIDGVEIVEQFGTGWRYARTLQLPHGPSAVALQWQGGRISLTGEVHDPSDILPLRQIAIRLLDLQAPITHIDTMLNNSSGLRATAREGVRLPGATDLYEVLIRAIVGQQISVARARTILVNFVHELGARYRTGHPSLFGKLNRLFPDAGRVAKELVVPPPDLPLDPQRILRLARRSIGAVVAASVQSKTGDLSPNNLADLPGVGPWTSAYVRLRMHEDRDAWLYGDVALVAGAKRLGILPSDLPAQQAHRELARQSEQWRPWRGYAAMRLWAALAD